VEIPPQRQFGLRIEDGDDIGGMHASVEIIAHAAPVADLRAGMIGRDERRE
jgi:hypothetical protein